MVKLLCLPAISSQNQPKFQQKSKALSMTRKVIKQVNLISGLETVLSHSQCHSVANDESTTCTYDLVHVDLSKTTGAHV